MNKLKALFLKVVDKTIDVLLLVGIPLSTLFILLNAGSSVYHGESLIKEAVEALLLMWAVTFCWFVLVATKWHIEDIQESHENE